MIGSQRQKAAAKLRRLSAYDRARGDSGRGGGNGTGATNGRGSQAGPANQQQQQQHVSELDMIGKEYFSGERFQNTRDPSGHWVSRYRTPHSSFSSSSSSTPDWRLVESGSKMRIVAAALCMCLNIGTDPPGIDRTNNLYQSYATLECWHDPNVVQPPHKSLELIGNTLQQQYARLQPKAKYEFLLDPTDSAIRRMCISLRRHARHERILFHYNGHGVPKPTVNGELWCFDKTYTLYVPLNIEDLLTWLGGPSIIILDCSSAGALLECYQSFMKGKQEEMKNASKENLRNSTSTSSNSSSTSSHAFDYSGAAGSTNAASSSSSSSIPPTITPDYSDSILLGACSLHQSLPLHPHLPMDLFTSCLTTPLKIALKFFATTSFLSQTTFDSHISKPGAYEELLEKIPGKLTDKKTPLGELNWIYTAITDTIAWNLFPRELFQKLFRVDVMLPSLLRNFLLATRILSHYNCTTFCAPALPNQALIASHPLWASWDLVLEQYLLSLDKYLNFVQPGGVPSNGSGSGSVSVAASSAPSPSSTPAPSSSSSSDPSAASLAKFPREHINFFTEHLTAFEVWLDVGGGIQQYTKEVEAQLNPPIQLPILLQSLLSQVHRRRTLILLARYLGRGQQAVNYVLSVGMFNYLLKLLQSPDLPLREVLVFIWSRIIALDKSVQVDLVKEGHQAYFLAHLAAPSVQPVAPVPSGGQRSAAPAKPVPLVPERSKIMSCFILSAICDTYPLGQRSVLRANGLVIAAGLLDSESPSLRKWSCLLLGKLWQDYSDARSEATQRGIPEKLCTIIADPVPEVRAAALFALGTFMSAPNSNSRNGADEYSTSRTERESSVSRSTLGTLHEDGREDDPTTPQHSGSSGVDRDSTELLLAKNFSQLVVDASTLVREELVLALAQLVESQKDEFVCLAHDRMLGEDASSSSQATGTVPPSPIQHALASPLASPPVPLMMYPNGPGAGVFALPAASMSSAGAGGGTGANSVAASPSLRTSLSVFSLPPTSGTSVLPSGSPAGPVGTSVAGGLAISLSPTMMSTQAPRHHIPGMTPMSPLHVTGWNAPGSGAGLISPSNAQMQQQQQHQTHMSISTRHASIAPSSASAATNSGNNSASASSATTPAASPYTSARGISRIQSAGNLVGSAGNSAVNTPSSSSLNSSNAGPSGLSTQDTILYNQRLLLWRVIRTLSHDPYPSVAAVALQLRKMIARSVGTSGLLLLSQQAHSQQQQQQQQYQQSLSTLQSSPLISSNIGLLHAVPEATLDGEASYMQTTGGGTGSNVSSARPSVDANGASGMPPHLRGRSDGSLSTMTQQPGFDTIVTRPRSRPASEIDSQPPPPHPTPTQGPPGGVLAQMQSNANANNTTSNTSTTSSSNTLTAPSAGGTQSGSGSGSSTRAASPVQPKTSASTSPAQSPRHHATPAPTPSSSAVVPTEPQTTATKKRIMGTRLTFDSASDSTPSFFQPVIPSTSIYARACEYFIAPLGAVGGSSGAGGGASGANGAANGGSSLPSEVGNADSILEHLLITSWRAKRNSDLIHSACQIRNDFYDTNDRGTFDQISALNTGFEQVSALLFHPFENMLVVAEKRQIALWDCKEFERITQFSNENARGTKISSVNWINEQHQSLLLAGSDDGVVRLWRNVHLPQQPEIVSAWLAVRSMPRSSGVGLVLDWQQETGHLLAAGPVDSIRVWDVEREICVLDLPVDSESYVSSICSVSDGSIVFTGCGDGVVRLFDLRVDNHQIHTVSRHQTSIVSVRSQKYGGGNDHTLDGELISASVNGEIHTCDTRMLSHSSEDYNYSSTTSTTNIQTMHGFEKQVPLDALAVHDHAPLFAAGSRKQVVRIGDFKSDRGAQSGNTVTKLKYHKGFMGHRIGPVTALHFHPHKLLLAVGALNPLVSILAAFPPSSM